MDRESNYARLSDISNYDIDQLIQFRNPQSRSLVDNVTFNLRKSLGGIDIYTALAHNPGWYIACQKLENGLKLDSRRRTKILFHARDFYMR